MLMAVTVAVLVMLLRESGLMCCVLTAWSLFTLECVLCVGFVAF